MKLTFQQKLDALAYRFYQGAEWRPNAGDYYTTSRADLELYQVVSVDEDVVRTRYTEGSDAISEWPADDFLTGGFGPKRVFVPDWVLAPRPDACDQAPVPDDESLWRFWNEKSRRLAEENDQLKLEITGLGLAMIRALFTSPMPAGVDIPRLPRGTPVEKVGGYPFPGTVVVAFHTLAGQERFVVEATGPDYAGMLHIFNGGQLRAATAAEGSADA